MTDMWTGFDQDAANTDRAAEAAVIGTCMIDSALVDDIRLDVGDFDDHRHGLIWSTIVDLHVDGAPTDATAVASALIDAGQITKAGGHDYLAALLGEAPPLQSATWHAARVAEMAKRRRVQRFAADAAHISRRTVDADDMIEALRGRLDHVEGDTEPEDGPVPWSQVIEEGLEAIERAASGEEARGIPTGLIDLDNAVGGFKPGDVVIVAGRPRAGKSILLGQTAAHVGLDLEYPALYLSLEMRRPEVYNRLVASRLGINLSSLSMGTIADHELSRLARQAGMSAESPLWIDDTPGQTLASIGALARKWKRRHGLRLLVIDYLQLVTPPRAENRQVEVSQISRGLKLLASQLEIPILVAAQLNRNSESRSNKTPALGDLRESGSLESDASVVILVHNEAVADPDSIRQGEADLILAKHRNGAQTTVNVAAQLHYARFASMAGHDHFGGR